MMRNTDGGRINAMTCYEPSRRGRRDDFDRLSHHAMRLSEVSKRNFPV